MRNSKHTPKRKRGAKVIPVLGAAGLLSLVGGAFATTAPIAELSSQKTAILGEEELSDVSPVDLLCLRQGERQVSAW